MLVSAEIVTLYICKWVNMSYRFFFSYARENRDPLLNRFYEDLSKQVLLTQYHAIGEVGFFDGEAIKSGAPWKAQLGDALRSSKTFVAVCSPAYINSEYCGKEFKFFLNRYDKYVSDRQPANPPRLIQAVLWGAPSGSLHQAMTEFQYTDDEYPPVYAQEGLRYMMLLKGYEDDYNRFVVRLARKLVDFSTEHTLPDAPNIGPLDEIESAFATRREETAETDGSNVWFIFVAGRPNEFPSERTSVDRYKKRGGRDWKPFIPDSSDTVGIIAQATASKYSLYFGELPLDEQIEARIEKAEARGEPVIVFVDAWTLKISNYRKWMLRLDKLNFENCMVMVPVNHPDPETERHLPDLKMTVRKTFKWKAGLRNKMYFRDSISSARELRSLVLKSLAEFSNKTVEKSTTTRQIEDRQIRQEAQAEGISLEKTPLVASVGGSVA
jgi:FxsC-like protein